jgi:pyruvate dehydrogenase E2 component (dihydrolipoamide acetyltransferase)
MAANDIPFSQWRKIAMATWGARNDGWIMADLDIDARKAIDYIADARAATGAHVTMMHLVGRASALVVDELPVLNGRVVAGRFRPASTIDIFFTVSMRNDVTSDGHDAEATDLSGAVVREVDRKPPWQIAEELDERARRIRSGNDPMFKATKQLTQLMPPMVLRSFVNTTTFLTEQLQLPIPPLGLEARPFGAVLVTNIGTFGLDRAYAPMPSMCKAPINVAVGRVKDMPVAEDGEVVVRPVLPLTAGIDHRFIDGYQAATISRIFRAYLEDPASVDPIPRPARGAARAAAGSKRRSTRKTSASTKGKAGQKTATKKKAKQKSPGKKKASAKKKSGAGKATMKRST